MGVREDLLAAAEVLYTGDDYATAGTQVTDTSGNARHATLETGASWAIDDAIGRPVLTPATNSKAATRATDADITTILNAGSAIACWFKPGATRGKAFFVGVPGTNTVTYDNISTNDTINPIPYWGASFSLSQDMLYGRDRWVHLILQRNDDDTFDLAYNGHPVADLSDTCTDISGDSLIRLVDNDNTSRGNCDLAEFVIFGRPLTETEMLWLGSGYHSLGDSDPSLSGGSGGSEGFTGVRGVSKRLGT